MRSFLLICLLSALYMPVSAATSITSPTVSGHWTLAGSPYKIYNNVKVDTNDILTIEAGVEVIFQGSYRLVVCGRMRAEGSAEKRIKFYVSDTTGFSTDLDHATGGWHGIQYTLYEGIAIDNSVLQYCDISYTKFDSVDQYANPWMNTLYTRRNLSVTNCDFFRNFVPKVINYGLFFIDHLSSDYTFEMSDCNIHDNIAPMHMGWIMGGYASLRNNKIHDNITGLGTIRIDATQLAFENNDCYRNNCISHIAGGSFLSVIGNKASEIRGNRIYENTSAKNGAVMCGGGKVDIINNYICNNHHESFYCGLSDGGGALQLTNNYTGIDHDNTYYRVRNNIIANNFSPLYGAGINVLSAKTDIYNNHFINNKSGRGSCLYINNPWEPYLVNIKNNLFYGNIDLDSTTHSTNVHVYNGGPVSYEYNWTQRPYYLDFHHFSNGYTIAGDTLTNIIGSNPNLVNPTLSQEFTDNAALADFRLADTSPCIDKGDTVGVIVDPTDFIGNPRYAGVAIDLGAYEHVPGSTPTTAISAAPTPKLLQAHPNPASNVVFVATPSADGKIQIIDISGKVVLSKAVTHTLTSFDIHNIPRGLYFASWSRTGNTAIVEKMIFE